MSAGPYPKDMGQHSVKQQSPWPVAKVVAAGAGGIGMTLLLTILDSITSSDIDAPWGAFLTAAAAFAAGYIRKSKSTEL